MNALPITPFSRGLMNALSMANVLQTMQRQEEELRLTKAREQRMGEQQEWARGRDEEERAYRRERDQRADSRQDALTRLEADTNPGLVSLAPGQTERPVTFDLPESLKPYLPGTFPIQTMAPVENAVDLAGGRYMALSPQERIRNSVEQQRAVMAPKLEFEQAKMGARNGAQLQRDMLLEQGRNDRAAEANETRKKIEENRAKRQEAKASGGGAGKEPSAAAVTTAEDKLNSAMGALAVLEEQEKQIHAKRLAIGEKLKAGSAAKARLLPGGDDQVTDAEAKKLHAELKIEDDKLATHTTRLRAARNKVQILRRGVPSAAPAPEAGKAAAATPAPAPAAPKAQPKAATGQKVSLEQLRKFAAAKRVDLDAARRLAKQEGFEVIP
jgi:hypothetical protein